LILLPRAARRDLFRAHSHVEDRGEDLIAVLAVTAEEEISRRLVVGKRLAQLLRDPACRRMFGGTDVDRHSSCIVDDEEDVEHAKGDGGDRKEVHRGDDLAVIAEKGAPALASVGTGWAPGHEPRDGAFGDLEGELLDPAMDP
jgi:hypothetical protein